jgi:RimJ/RimL family protein N-acetyltransferase
MSYESYFKASLQLETEKVLLRAMKPEDFENFLPITGSPGLWKYFSRELNDDKQLLAWIREAMKDRGNQNRVPFTIIDKMGNAVCGSTSLGNISFPDKRIEIGWTWLGEPFLGSGINTHCKFLLLQYTFEVMMFERVEIKTDNLNERAKKALRKIGAVEEGVLRSHMQMPYGRRRDSVYFSILKQEWESVKLDYFHGVQALKMAP